MSRPAFVSRWAPTASMLLVSLISYIDRNTLALLAPTILRETRLSAEQYGFIVSAFSITYMLANPVWGRVLDRFGLKRGMTAAVSIWSLASAAHALAGSFAGFAAARAALGFGEGATFPGGLRTVVQTLEPARRSRGVAVAYSGGSLGAIVTPILVTPVALWWGWRAAFLFTGLLGVLWLAVWSVLSRRPDVAARQPVHAAARSQDRPRFRDPRLWSFMLAYAFGALPLGFVIYIAALYLHRGLGKSQAEIGQVLWIPPLGWEAGYFFWGWLADRLGRAAGDPLRVYRRLLLAAALAGLPLALTPRLASFPLVMAELFFSMFVAAAFIILTVAYATHVFSAAHSGLIAGLGAGAWSAAVALFMPVFGRLMDLNRPAEAFGLAACFPVLGYSAWLWLNRRPPVQPIISPHS